MMKTQFIRLVLGFIAVLSLVLSPELTAENAQAQSTDKENLAVLFVVDDSGSMAQYDPQDLRYTAIKLMISSLDLGDKVGFVRFSTTSEIVTKKFIGLDTNQDKKDLLKLIQPVAPNGYTDYKAALLDAGSLLRADPPANYRTIVIFLTDGRPEISNPYEGYEGEIEVAAKSLGVPIYAIGLTSAGQSAILNNMATLTSGKVIRANTANDLIDSYLQILGELKDRTVVNSVAGSTRNSFNFELAPALVPYVSRVSFVASHAPGMKVKLFSPSGVEVTSSDLAVSFAMIEDPNFTVYTIESPASGQWQFVGSGAGEIQTRAILRSKLRANIISPGNTIETGKPIVLVANLIEEMDDGSLVKIIGTAQFTAKITLPDGSMQSLDRFYDDGTNGDLVSGDGDFSREFVNTNQEGVYKITLNGNKDMIPVSGYRSVVAVDIPRLMLIEPQDKVYEIRSEALPFTVGFDTSQDISEKYEGGLSVEISDPDGVAQVVDLPLAGQQFTASYLPMKEGVYSVRVNTENAFYQGLPITDEVSGQFQTLIIPTIIVNGSYFGFDEPFADARFEIAEIETGIPVTINLISTSDEQELVTVVAQQLPGFKISEIDPIQIQPGLMNKVLVHLEPTGNLIPGAWSGFLRINPATNVDIEEKLVPIAFEVYQKGVLFSVKETVVDCEKIFCFRTKPVGLVLSGNSTSTKEELVTLSLSGSLIEGFSPQQLYIKPGENEYELLVTVPKDIQPGEYAGKINFKSENQSLKLTNELGGDDLRFSFEVESLWVRCRKNIFICAAILITLIIILSVVFKRIAKAREKPRLKGTFIYHKKGYPTEQVSVDLNEKVVSEVRIGSDPVCDIYINHTSVNKEHFKLIVEKNEGKVTIKLVPVGIVYRGYRQLDEPIEIEEGTTYYFGEYEFRFIKDPNIN